MTGCGTTMLNTANHYGTQTNVELSHNNFKVIKQVEGFSSASYVLGIGGLSRNAARNNAINDMLKKANLRDGQTIVNIYVKNHISTIFGLYVRISYTATGEVIEFIPKSQPTSYPYAQEAVTTTQFAPKYRIGDIYDDGDKKGIIFNISQDGQHGKIVYEEMLDDAAWCTKKQLNTFLGATDKNDGELNMSKIKSCETWKTDFPAFAKCAELGAVWYLPAINELKEIIDNETVSSSIKWKSYFNIWSSTETAADKAERFIRNNDKKTKEYNFFAVAKF